MKESWRRGEDCLGDDTSSESEERTGSGWFTSSFSSCCFNYLGLLFWKFHWEWIGEAAGCIGTVLGGLEGMGIASAESCDLYKEIRESRRLE